MKSNKKVVLPLVVALVIAATGCEKKEKAQLQNFEIEISEDREANQERDIKSQISALSEYLDVYGSAMTKEYYEIDELVDKYPLLSSSVFNKNEFYNKYLNDSMKVYSLIDNYNENKYRSFDEYVCIITDQLNYMYLYKQAFGEYDDNTLIFLNVLVDSLPEGVDNPFIYYQDICDTVYDAGVIEKNKVKVLG